MPQRPEYNASASFDGAHFDEALRTPHFKTVDVLVLGAGLAGMRAAWAAAEAEPHLETAVITNFAAPKGSSFANIHNRLGMHVCNRDEEREAFVREAAAVAAPGWIDKKLTAALAEEGFARYADMIGLGVDFLRTQNGGVTAFPSCFSRHSRRAVLFRDLGRAFGLFKDKIESLGARFLPGWRVVELLRDGHGRNARIVGALCLSLDENQALAVRAKSVILALGGPAKLFRHAMSGPGTPGVSYGLLRRAGAELINTAYLQHMWAEPSSRQFFDVARPAVEPSWTDPDTGLPLFADRFHENPAALAAERRSHCPVGFGLKDAVLDFELASRIGPDGTVAMRTPDGTPLAAAPMAHAGNGGARIDAHAETTVWGLFAVGECAGGMHGANRIGGAMVAATQVFGRRAGREAARRATAGHALGGGAFRALAARALAEKKRDVSARRLGLETIREGMQAHAVLGGAAGATMWKTALEERTDSDWLLSLCRETALAVVEAQVEARSASRGETQTSDQAPTAAAAESTRPMSPPVQTRP